MIGMKEVEIKAARSLPPSGLSNNSFKNSYLYDDKSNTLFIHHSRLSSSGDFGLVAIHALSHIKVNPSDISNDADPEFTAEFYTNLRLLSQDLYKQSTRSQGGGSSGSSAPSDRRPGLGMRRASSAGVNKLLRGGSGGALDAAGGAGGAGGGQKSSTSPGGQNQPVDYFAATNINERMKQYAQQGGIPMEFLDRYSQETATTQGKRNRTDSASFSGDM
jgi:hypothetical protein